MGRLEACTAAAPVNPLMGGTIEPVGLVALMRGEMDAGALVDEVTLVTDSVEVVVFKATVVERLP